MKNLALNPTFSANLARDVYALTKLPSVEAAVKSLNLDYGEYFTFSNEKLVTGKTGGPAMIKCRTAFGFCLLGRGAYVGHAFIIFRGTQYLADWLTNLNVGVSRSAYHQPVHDGFNQAFKTMLPKIAEFVAGFRTSGITHVHCIGHSLGGALATLCSEWLKSNAGISAQTYTFGSPRVGLKGFANICSKRIGSERIYRAYHKTDIVPCIPIWPFVHTPDSGVDYYLPSPGLMPGSEYHSMKHYCDSVKEKSWKTLGAIKAETRTEPSIIRWLKEETAFRSTLNVIEWLGDALLFVLKKCLRGAEWIISASVGTTLTLTDQLAFILHKGIDLSKDLSLWVVRLMKKILRFLGYSLQVDAAEMTFFFIKNVFIQLQQKLNIVARSALSQALVEGRAI